VRDAPATTAPMLGILRPPDTVAIGAEQDGWLRTATPFAKGKHGWILEDARRLGMQRLMQRVDCV
jgi:hypothetical protein